jgi:hypothetical protein
VIDVAAFGSVVAGAVSVARKVGHRLEATGGDFSKYERLFRLGRTSGQVAVLLGINEEDMPPIMHFLGFELDRPGVWRVGNAPDRELPRELALVANTAAHMHLGADVLQNGLAELLRVPQGERARQAEGIFRQLQYREVENGVADEDPFITRS